MARPTVRQCDIQLRKIVININRLREGLLGPEGFERAARMTMAYEVADNWLDQRLDAMAVEGAAA